LKVSRLPDATALESKHVEREPSPEFVERKRQEAEFRAQIESLTESDAFQVDLEPGDKALTVRQRLLRVARDMGTEIAVRKHGEGLAVGLMTPARRSNRGRKPKDASAGS
jgi:hypothetical protein